MTKLMVEPLIVHAIDDKQTDNVYVCTLPSEYATFGNCQRIMSGVLPIDYFLAKSLTTDCYFTEFKNEDISRVIFQAILQLSQSLREGHVCLPLTAIAGQHFGGLSHEQTQENTDKVGYCFPPLAKLTALLSESNFAHSSNHPIVYADSCLYLRRYYTFEKSLQELINKRKSTFVSRFSLEDVTSCIQTLFPLSASAANSSEIDWQKVAVANALQQGFSVIAGGPGTGKTYTVTKLLAALILLNDAQGVSTNLSMSLVAPTGKAAQRLSESLVQAVADFKDIVSDDILGKIPTQAQTIHRLLGVIPNQAHFRHHEDNRLVCDVLLVDEVSMVDLPLMQRLLLALPSTTQVILLGDADQLPSVEVGSVLSDIAPRPYPGFSSENQAYLTHVTGYQNLPVGIETSADHCVFLTKSRRFDGKGGIGLLAQAVIAGKSQASWQLLHDNAHTETLTFIPPSSDPTQGAELLALVQQYYLPLFKANNIDACFNAFAQFRFLCATRQGHYGVESINGAVENYLMNVNIIPRGQTLYQGKPIMITANHYGLGLYNGDIGMVWRTEAGHLQVAFEKANGEYMWVLPSKLPEYESVYAMTIHKTQGSEFSHVAMLLPEQADNKLLSRELLYTGITRAKKQLSITCHEKVWNKAVEAQVKRFSNLRLF